MAVVPKKLSAHLALIALVAASIQVLAPAAWAADPGASINLTVDGVAVRQGASLPDGTRVGVGTAALLNPGLGERTLISSFDSNTVYQAGTAVAPEGWQLSYSIDGGSTWALSEPSPASAVTNIKATASEVAAGAISGYSQVYSTETAAFIPSSTFSASTGGDGWGVAFYDNYVFNVYHHSSDTVLDCHLRTTGERCGPSTVRIEDVDSAGTPYSYYSGPRSDLAVDALRGRLYEITAPTGGDNANTAGILCIDVASLPAQSCGFTPLSEFSGASDSWPYFSEITKTGTKLFGSVTGNVGTELLCYDLATDAACANSPALIVNNRENYGPRVSVIGSRIYTKSEQSLSCFSTVDLSPCGGSFPVSINGTDAPMIQHASTQGVVDGLCLGFSGCYDLSGASTAWLNPLDQVGGGDIWFQGAVTQNRAYNSGGGFIACWDYSTNAPCADFQSPGFSYLYQIAIDPENPGCLWTDEDAGRILNLDAITGDLGCTSSPVITLQPSQFAPRYSCSSEIGITEWSNLRISGLVGGGTAEHIYLTVRDASGNAVSGWTNREIILGADLDMTGLDVGLSGSRPTFSFAFTGVQGNVTSATIALDYKGKGPELCASAVLTGADGETSNVSGTLIEVLNGVTTTSTSQRELALGDTSGPNLAQTVPSVPLNLTGTGLNTSAVLTFRPPLDNGGLDLADYRYSLNGGQSWSTATALYDNGNGTLSIPLSGLTAGATYAIQVQASNALGYSDSASITLTAQLVSLNQLTDLTLDVGSISLALVSSDNLGYTYTVTPANVCSVSANVISLIDVGTCQVTALLAGDSTHLAATTTRSFVVNPAPVLITVPSVPLNLAANVGNGQISLTWDAPADNGGAAVSDYQIQYKVGSSWIPFTDGLSSNQSVVVTGLNNGSQYQFKVSATNSAGTGAFTSPVTATPARTPGAPTDLTANKSGTSASLAWVAPSSVGGSAITDYVIQYKESSSSIWLPFADGVSTSASATVTGLDASLEYDFQVSAKNSVGTGTSTSTVNLATEAIDSGALVAWLTPNSGGNTIRKYLIGTRVVGDVNWNYFDTGSTQLSGEITGLDNGQNYEVVVAALIDDPTFDPLGLAGSPYIVSSYTSVVSLTPAGAPLAPTLATTAGAGQVELSWTVPGGNGTPVIDFDIKYKAQGSSTWLTANDGSSTNPTYVVTGLQNGTQYDFKVAAISEIGLGEYSTVSSAKPRTLPGAPTGLQIVSDGSRIQGSWNAPASDGGDSVTDYLIQYKLVSDSAWITYQHAVGAVTSFDRSGFAPDVEYSWRVASINSAGTGPFGASRSVVMAALPVAPPVVVPPVVTPAPSSDQPGQAAKTIRIRKEVRGNSTSTNVSVAPGASATLALDPTPGLVLTSVLVDGVSVTLVNNEYTFTNVDADHVIQVSYAPEILSGQIYSRVFFLDGSAVVPVAPSARLSNLAKVLMASKVSEISVVTYAVGKPGDAKAATQLKARKAAIVAVLKAAGYTRPILIVGKFVGQRKATRVTTSWSN